MTITHTSAFSDFASAIEIREPDGLHSRTGYSMRRRQVRKQLDCVCECGTNHFKRLGGTGDRTGKIDDQRGSDYPTHPARQHAVRVRSEGRSPHRFGETGGFSF